MDHVYSGDDIWWGREVFLEPIWSYQGELFSVIGWLQGTYPDNLLKLQAKLTVQRNKMFSLQ